MELFYPDLNIQIGGYAFTQGVGLEASSSKSSYFDWAKVKFTGQFKEKVALTAKAPASIKLGYNGVLEEVFTGYVAAPYDGGGGMNEVLLKDGMLLLEQTQISNTFLNATPQDILGYALEQAGVRERRLSAQVYPAKPRVSILRQSALSLLNTVHAAWAITVPFFFLRGVFYWGVIPNQEQVYRFEYGENIIALTRAGGLWNLETVSAPFIRHSQRIAVQHPQVAGEFDVEKVVFTTNPAGFIRTNIYFH